MQQQLILQHHDLLLELIHQLLHLTVLGHHLRAAGFELLGPELLLLAAAEGGETVPFKDPTTFSIFIVTLRSLFLYLPLPFTPLMSLTFIQLLITTPTLVPLHPDDAVVPDTRG